MALYHLKMNELKLQLGPQPTSSSYRARKGAEPTSRMASRTLPHRTWLDSYRGAVGASLGPYKIHNMRPNNMVKQAPKNANANVPTKAGFRTHQKNVSHSGAPLVRDEGILHLTMEPPASFPEAVDTYSIAGCASNTTADWRGLAFVL